MADPPRIFNFLTKNLLAPDDVKFSRKNALNLPCGASGNNLQWTWKHNGTAIAVNDYKFTVGADGTLYGSTLRVHRVDTISVLSGTLLLEWRNSAGRYRLRLRVRSHFSMIGISS